MPKIPFSSRRYGRYYFRRRVRLLDGKDTDRDQSMALAVERGSFIMRLQVTPASSAEVGRTG